MKALIERLRKSGAGFYGLAALLLVIVLQFVGFAPLERIQLQVFDTYQTLSPRDASTDDSVVVVDIDEESIDALGQWPWPRTDIATLTDRLAAAGAQVVIYDIVFSEADRTSPEQVSARLADPALGQRLQGLPSHDAQLAESFAKAPVVTATFLDREERGREFEAKTGFTLFGSMPYGNVAEFPGALLPLPALEEAAKGNGFVSLEPDPDGVVRRVPLVAIHQDTLIPALSLEAIRVAKDAGSPNLQASDGSGEGTSVEAAAVAVRIGEQEIPVNDAGEMWVHFPIEGSQTTLRAASIIKGEMSDAALAEAVSGKMVIIGGSATGLQDLVSTPAADLTAGVNVHAAAIEQIEAGHFLQRPDWATGLEFLLVVLLGVTLSFLLPKLGAVLGAIAALVGVGVSIGASWLGFTQFQYLLDPTYPALALVLVYLVQTVADYYREEQQRSYIHAAFDRYLSPELVNQIADDPGKLELGGEERDMSVMMCDIRGFSRISEQYPPQGVINFLIKFLTPMSDILMAHKATLDKYIGDAILAFWNAPLDDPDHHRNSARAALAMTAKLQELNTTRPAVDGGEWPENVSIGIGLNSGICCVGNMGSEQRLAYTLIGDTVNVASRFEGLTKQYGVQIIVGEALAQELDGFALFEIDQVRVVGREGAEKIFVLLGDERRAAEASHQSLAKVHGEVLAAYHKQDWDGAQTLLTENASFYAEAGIPKLAELFQTRIAALKANPPGADWDGVFSATEK